MTAEVIFCKVDTVLSQHNINCVCLSVDNMSVNMEIRNSLCSRIREKNNQAYVLGCPCHILHNTSSKAASALSESTGFDIEV